jgi:hypothetical protein
VLVAAMLAGLPGWQGACAAERTVPADVAGVRVSLPVPAGFADAATAAPQLKGVMDNVIPAPMGRRLAIFVSEADVATFKAGRGAALDRYFMVYLSRTLEPMRLDAGEFKDIRDLFRNQQAALLKALQPKTQAVMNDSARTLRDKYGYLIQSLSVGEMVPLGVFHESDTSVSMGMLSKLKTVIAGKAVETPQMSSTTAALVKTKVVGMSVHATYGSPADIDWVKRVTTEWVQALSRSNP